MKQVINEVKEYDDISIYVDPYYYETVFQQKMKSSSCFIKNAGLAYMLMKKLQKDPVILKLLLAG